MNRETDRSVAASDGFADDAPFAGAAGTYSTVSSSEMTTGGLGCFGAPWGRKYTAAGRTRVETFMASPGSRESGRGPFDRGSFHTPTSRAMDRFRRRLRKKTSGISS